MYCDYFGLQEPPFSIAPNPRYLYMSEQHEEALAHLLYGITADGSFILLTGEVGTGKTTLSRHLIEHLPDTTDFALILNPQLEPRELLEAICEELRIETGAGSAPSMKQLCSLIYDFLLQQHAQGRNTLLIIDEGQQLSFEALEQVRLLTNLETSEAKLLRVVLLGQPELLTRLARDDLRQLSQRVSARYHLGPLSEPDLKRYIEHRLHVAGLSRPVFPAATIDCLYRLSSGLPRVINQICDRALLGTYVQTGNEVTVKTLQKAAREVLGDESGACLHPRRSMLFWVSLVILLGLLGWGTGLGLSILFSGQLKVPEYLSWQAFVKEQQAPVLGDADFVVLRQQLFPWEKGDTGLENVAVSSDSDVGMDVGNGFEAIQVSNANAGLTNGQPISHAEWPAPEDVNLAQVLAYMELFSIWQLEYDPRQDPVVCDYAARHGLGCLSMQGTMLQLMQLDRPAVITLKAEEQDYEALLVQLEAGWAEVIVNAQVHKIPVSRLKELWGGQFTLLWRQPPEYPGPLWPGSQGAGVDWLNRQLAQQRGEKADRKLNYDAQLYLQVKHFQQQQGLAVDGIAGPLTLIRLNSLLQPELPRLSG